MDREIMVLIDREVALLPKTKCKNRAYLEGLYVFWKYKLSSKFPGDDEYQYIAKEVARKYLV